MKDKTAHPSKPRDRAIKDAAKRAIAEAQDRRKSAAPAALPQELGGVQNAPEPTRYGDWERKGIASDF